jgi:hypothetical protein
MEGVVSVASVVLLTVLAGEASPPEPARPAPGSTAPATEGRAAAPGAEAALTLTQALDRALAEGWRELHIETECGTEAGFRTAEIYGSGVAVWDRKTQVQLGRAEVRALLETFRETDFPNMRETYGGRRDPVVQEKQSPRATCRVALRLDGLLKHVAQLQHGRQSEELRRLASRILEKCEGAAGSGRAASSLADGLAKVAAGELAPETFHALVHRKVTRNDSDKRESDTWLLRVDGRQASMRRQLPEKGYAEAIVLELSLEDVTSLAQLLRETRVDDLPVNLYAEHYTELVVSVLNWRQALQARRFAGMTPTTHGAKQKQFDQIFAKLRDLERRVAAEGRPGSLASRDR